MLIFPLPPSACFNVNVFFFWNPSLKAVAWLMRCLAALDVLLCIWLLMPLGCFFFLLLTFSFFYFLWLVFLCSIQVRIAPTVTTWSNKTPTALPRHPPAASLSDTQVYPSLFLLEQNSAHLNIYSYIFSTPLSQFSLFPSLRLLIAFECFYDARSSFSIISLFSYLSLLLCSPKLPWVRKTSINVLTMV